MVSYTVKFCTQFKYKQEILYDFILCVSAKWFLVIIGKCSDHYLYCHIFGVSKLSSKGVIASAVAYTQAWQECQESATHTPNRNNIPT